MAKSKVVYQSSRKGKKTKPRKKSKTAQAKKRIKKSASPALKLTDLPSIITKSEFLKIFQQIKKSFKKSKTKQITRPLLNSITNMIVASFLIGTTFLLIVSIFLPKSRFQEAKERLIKNSNDYEAHLILAEAYLDHNQFSEAEKELLQAENSIESAELNNTVLGEKTSLKLDQLWQRKKEADPKEIRKLIQLWEKVIAVRPDYRDGYLRLAYYHFRLFENQKAKEYLQKALELDPNFSPAKELEKLLGD